MSRGIAFALLLVAGTPAFAQTTAEWIDTARRVHGGFGSLVAVGLRMGQTALRDLEAAPREVDVTFHDGIDTPCACVVDGILVATQASPGQRTPDGANRRFQRLSQVVGNLIDHAMKYTPPGGEIRS